MSSRTTSRCASALRERGYRRPPAEGAKVVVVVFELQVVGRRPAFGVEMLPEVRRRDHAEGLGQVHQLLSEFVRKLAALLVLVLVVDDEVARESAGTFLGHVVRDDSRGYQVEAGLLPESMMD